MFLGQDYNILTVIFSIFMAFLASYVSAVLALQFINTFRECLEFKLMDFFIDLNLIFDKIKNENK